MFRTGENLGIQNTGNCRLLNQRPGISRMERIESSTNAQRIIDDVTEVGPGAFSAISQHERGTLKASIDEIGLKGLRVLQILLG